MIVGEVANQHAVIIKAAQNVLIGVVAFFIALYLSTRGEKGGQAPSLGIVREKFPKFILGFVAASLVCLWFLVFRPIFYAKPFGSFIVADVLVLWAASFAVDFIYGFSRWSITFVWPAVVGAGITVVLFCSLIGRLKWSVVGSTLVVFAALCVIMIPLGFLGVYPNTKLWLILGVYDALCIYGLKYFLSRQFDEKMEGLFHV